MDRANWQALCARIVPQDADDLDDLVAPYDPAVAATGRDVFPDLTAATAPDVAFKRADLVCIGVRVSARAPDTADRAARIAAFAAERDVEVVVLAETDVTGFERFGFRTERLVGDTQTERSQCEAQIRRFWNIDLVL